MKFGHNFFGQNNGSRSYRVNVILILYIELTLCLNFSSTCWKSVMLIYHVTQNTWTDFSVHCER